MKAWITTHEISIITLCSDYIYITLHSCIVLKQNVNIIFFNFSFFSLITGCCYKFLENPASIKSGTTKSLIFNLLGVMVKKYNYGLGETTFCYLQHVRLKMMSFTFHHSFLRMHKNHSNQLNRSC